MSHKLILGKTGSGKSYYTKDELKKHPRVLVYDVIGEYTDGVVFEDFPSLYDFLDKRFYSDFRAIYRPLDPPGEFDMICSIVYTMYDMVFIVEEVDTFSVNSISLPFANIIQRGRHNEISLWGISQRPYRVNRTLSSQCKEVICFRMTEPRDVDYIRFLMGDKAAEEVKNLKLFYYVYWKGQGEYEVTKK